MSKIEGDIRRGRRGTKIIDGVEHAVGINDVAGQWQAAYLPKTGFRYKAGDIFEFDGLEYKVLESGQSPFVPRMVLLKLVMKEETLSGTDA